MTKPMRVTLVVLWVLGSVALAIGVCMLLDGCAPRRVAEMRPDGGELCPLELSSDGCVVSWIECQDGGERIVAPSCVDGGAR